jgi:hypothetical protein
MIVHDLYPPERTDLLAGWPHNPLVADRELLPDIVGRLLERHDGRRAARWQAWREHTPAQRAFYERYQRLAADIARATERGMDHAYGLGL